MEPKNDGVEDEETLFQRDDFQVLNFGRVSFLFGAVEPLGDELTLRELFPQYQWWGDFETSIRTTPTSNEQ